MGREQMFSMKEKQYLAHVIEKTLKELNHPEMPTDKIEFRLHIRGKATWSFADIEPNWKFGIDNPPTVNPFNEMSREIHKLNPPSVGPVMLKYIKEPK